MHLTHTLIAAYLSPFYLKNHANLYNNRFLFFADSDSPDWTKEGHFLQDILDNTDKIKVDRYSPTYIDESDDIPGRRQKMIDEMTSPDNFKLDTDHKLELEGLFGQVPPTLQQPETFHPSLTNHTNSTTEELEECQPKGYTKNIKTVHSKPHPDLIEGMRYRRLGSTDLLVSELCLGTSFYDNPAFIDLDHAKLIIRKAFEEYGINFFDTSEYDPLPIEPNSWCLYHHRALSTLKEFDRSKIVVSARLCSGNFGKPHRNRYLAWTRKNLLPPNLDSLEEGIDNILLVSGLDYLDIISLDRPIRYVPNSEIGEDTYCWGKEESSDDRIIEGIQALEKIINKGKARHIGLSNETIWGVYKHVQLTKNDPKLKPVFIQNMYNLLHRNEFESGLAEIALINNIPLVSYGTLAGGILTGKYIDPERINQQGADRPIQPKYNLDKMEYLSEDCGHLSFGPQNARCNLFPETYHTHRTVWCQHVTAEYLKIARTFGMTLGQLALKWNTTRDFMLSTIVAPRTIGQLMDTIGALNYPFNKDLEDDIHEVYLRYRAPTMGGVQVLSSVEDPDNLVPQNKFMTDYTTPILSGGSHWPSVPLKDEQLEKIENILNEKNTLLTIFGHLDVPNDRSRFNYRCWVERIEEDLPGEYFAVKESKLFGWDRYKFRDYTLVYKSPDEYRNEDTSEFHFYWKDGKIYVGPTTEKIKKFYEDELAMASVVQGRATDYIQMVKDDIDFMRSCTSIDSGWATIDVDSIYKKLLDSGIDVTDKSVIENIYENDEHKQLLKLIEHSNVQLCYYHERMERKDTELPPPGMEDVADPVVYNPTDKPKNDLIIE